MVPATSAVPLTTSRDGDGPRATSVAPTSMVRPARANTQAGMTVPPIAVVWLTAFPAQAGWTVQSVPTTSRQLEVVLEQSRQVEPFGMLSEPQLAGS